MSRERISEIKPNLPAILIGAAIGIALNMLCIKLGLYQETMSQIRYDIYLGLSSGAAFSGAVMEIYRQQVMDRMDQPEMQLIRNSPHQWSIRIQPRNTVCLLLCIAVTGILLSQVDRPSYQNPTVGWVWYPILVAGIADAVATGILIYYVKRAYRMIRERNRREGDN